MKPVGDTYLIQCDTPERISKEGELFVINDTNVDSLGFWKGKIVEYGTLVDEKNPDLLLIGTEVIMDMTKKAEAKVILDHKIYYVRKTDEIIGVIDNE